MLAFERSLWASTAGASPPCEPVDSNTIFDVVVVGGGIAGAVAFATLARGGAKAVLLEAKHLGSGATGRSGGFIVPALPLLRPASVISNLGETGERLVTAVAGSADFLFSTARELELDCDAIQGGWIHPTPSPEKLSQLGEDCEVWQKYGGDTVMLDKLQTERSSGVAGYEGGLFATSGGTIHPVKFVHGLVSSGVKQGGVYLENTPALQIQRKGDEWHIKTPTSTVVSKFVVICTNGRSANLTPMLSEAVLPVRICQTATFPVPDSHRAHLFGQGRCMSDTRVNLLTYRFDADWRLISGGFSSLLPDDGRRIGKHMAKRLESMLKMPAELQQEFVWFGDASITEDFLPKATELGPGGYALSACNGRGLAMSAMLSSELAKGILAGGPKDAVIPFSEPRPYPRRALATIGQRFYSLYGRMVDSFT